MLTVFSSVHASEIPNGEKCVDGNSLGWGYEGTSGIFPWPVELATNLIGTGP